MLSFAKYLHSHIVAQKLEHYSLRQFSLQVWSMPMIHIYAEKVVNFKAFSDHTSLTQLVADHTMMHCCLRLSVEKSFPSRKMTTTTLCKWEETSQSPGRAHNDRFLVISEYVCNQQLQLKALPQVGPDRAQSQELQPVRPTKSPPDPGCGCG